MSLEILPFHIVWLFSFVMLIFGYFRKSILITHLGAIAFMLCGLYGVVNGIPYVSGYTEATEGSTTILLKTISYQRDIVTNIASIVSMFVGVGIAMLMYIEMWKEEGW